MVWWEPDRDPAGAPATATSVLAVTLDNSAYRKRAKGNFCRSDCVAAPGLEYALSFQPGDANGIAHFHVDYAN